MHFPASRLTQFADQFTRKTFESICRADQPAYGDALRTFADLAKLACFALDNVTPAGNTDAEKSANISVKTVRSPGARLSERPLPECRSQTARINGWYVLQV